MQPIMIQIYKTPLRNSRIAMEKFIRNKPLHIFNYIRAYTYILHIVEFI